MFEVVWAEPTVAIQPRLYKDRDEMFYILEGDVEFLLNDIVKKASKGSLTYIPAGTVYSARVITSQTKVLNLHTRAGYDELISLHAGASHDQTLQNIDKGALKRIKEKIGLVELALTPKWS